MDDEHFEHCLSVEYFEDWYHNKLLPFEQDVLRTKMTKLLAEQPTLHNFNIGIEHRVPNTLFSTKNKTFDSAHDALHYLYTTYVVENMCFITKDKVIHTSFIYVDDQIYYDVEIITQLEVSDGTVAAIYDEINNYTPIRDYTEEEYRKGIRDLETAIHNIKFYFV